MSVHIPQTSDPVDVMEISQEPPSSTKSLMINASLCGIGDPGPWAARHQKDEREKITRNEDRRETENKENEEKDREEMDEDEKQREAEERRRR